MGCRPSKRAKSKMRTTTTARDEPRHCSCKSCSTRKKNLAMHSSDSQAKGSSKSWPEKLETRAQSHSRTKTRREDSDFQACSTTTAMYRRSASHASKITLRLSCDGSTLEIEQWDYNIGVQTPSPSTNSSRRPWASVPNLREVSSSQGKSVPPTGSRSQHSALIARQSGQASTPVGNNDQIRNCQARIETDRNSTKTRVFNADMNARPVHQLPEVDVLNQAYRMPVPDRTAPSSAHVEANVITVPAKVMFPEPKVTRNAYREHEKIDLHLKEIDEARDHERRMAPLRMTSSVPRDAPPFSADGCGVGVVSQQQMQNGSHSEFQTFKMKRSQTFLQQQNRRVDRKGVVSEIITTETSRNCRALPNSWAQSASVAIPQQSGQMQNRYSVCHSKLCKDMGDPFPQPCNQGDGGAWNSRRDIGGQRTSTLSTNDWLPQHQAVQNGPVLGCDLSHSLAPVPRHRHSRKHQTAPAEEDDLDRLLTVLELCCSLYSSDSKFGTKVDPQRIHPGIKNRNIDMVLARDGELLWESDIQPKIRMDLLHLARQDLCLSVIREPSRPQVMAPIPVRPVIGEGFDNQLSLLCQKCALILAPSGLNGSRQDAFFMADGYRPTNSFTHFVGTNCFTAPGVYPDGSFAQNVAFPITTACTRDYSNPICQYNQHFPLCSSYHSDVTCMERFCDASDTSRCQQELRELQNYSWGCCASDERPMFNVNVCRCDSNGHMFLPHQVQTNFVAACESCQSQCVDVSQHESMQQNRDVRCSVGEFDMTHRMNNRQTQNKLISNAPASQTVDQNLFSHRRNEVPSPVCIQGREGRNERIHSYETHQHMNLNADPASYACHGMHGMSYNYVNQRDNRDIQIGHRHGCCRPDAFPRNLAHVHSHERFLSHSHQHSDIREDKNTHILQSPPSDTLINEANNNTVNNVPSRYDNPHLWTRPEQQMTNNINTNNNNTFSERLDNSMDIDSYCSCDTNTPRHGNPSEHPSLQISSLSTQNSPVDTTASFPSHGTSTNTHTSSPVCPSSQACTTVSASPNILTYDYSTSNSSSQPSDCDLSASTGTPFGLNSDISVDSDFSTSFSSYTIDNEASKSDDSSPHDCDVATLVCSLPSPDGDASTLVCDPPSPECDVSTQISSLPLLDDDATQTSSSPSDDEASTHVCSASSSLEDVSTHPCNTPPPIFCTASTQVCSGLSEDVGLSLDDSKTYFVDPKYNNSSAKDARSPHSPVYVDSTTQVQCVRSSDDIDSTTLVCSMVYSNCNGSATPLRDSRATNYNDCTTQVCSGDSPTHCDSTTIICSMRSPDYQESPHVRLSKYDSTAAQAFGPQRSPTSSSPPPPPPSPPPPPPPPPSRLSPTSFPPPPPFPPPANDIPKQKHPSPPTDSTISPEITATIIPPWPFSGLRDCADTNRTLDHSACKEGARANPNEGPFKANHVSPSHQSPAPGHPRSAVEELNASGARPSGMVHLWPNFQESPSVTSTRKTTTEEKADGISTQSVLASASAIPPRNLDGPRNRWPIDSSTACSAHLSSPPNPLLTPGSDWDGSEERRTEMDKEKRDEEEEKEEKDDERSTLLTQGGRQESSYLCSQETKRREHRHVNKDNPIAGNLSRRQPSCSVRPLPFHAHYPDAPHQPSSNTDKLTRAHCPSPRSHLQPFLEGVGIEANSGQFCAVSSPDEPTREDLSPVAQSVYDNQYSGYRSDRLLSCSDRTATLSDIIVDKTDERFVDGASIKAEMVLKEFHLTTAAVGELGCPQGPGEVDCNNKELIRSDLDGTGDGSGSDDEDSAAKANVHSLVRYFETIRSSRRET